MTDSISDGHHTFGELYEHRRALTAVLAAAAGEIGRLEYQGLGFTVKPWTIETPSGVLTGYVDPDNQNRWAQEGHPIPEGWRKLYVEDR